MCKRFTMAAWGGAVLLATVMGAARREGGVLGQQGTVQLGTVQQGTVRQGPEVGGAMAFAWEMGIGTNLGNTLEATGGKDWKTVREFETGWGAPVTTKEMMRAVRAAGFKSIRIPVAWSNLMGADYKIHPDLMARVEEVVKWGIESDLIVVVNIHWDGGWWKKFPTEPQASMAKYKAIWGQISERFKDTSDRLVFESLNEELHFDDVWNRYGGMPNDKGRAYEIANGINQAFVDVVRGSGGGNAKRYLLIAGYCTDIALTTDPMFKMPRDPAGRSMVSVHYYSPPGFAILEKDADWGKALKTWGTEKDVADMKADFAKLKKFADAGIPVVLGEYGCAAGGKEPASVLRYNVAVCEAAVEAGCVPMLWDTGGYFDRRAGTFKDPKLGEEMRRIAGKR